MKGILVAVVILVLIVVIWYVLFDNKDNSPVVEEEEGFEISSDDLIQKIDGNEDIVILDVRTPFEHEELHIKNSLLLPLQNISPEGLESISLGEDKKDKEIIVYCRSGNRSASAYEVMKSLGYTNVKSLSGGIMFWEREEYLNFE